MPIRVAITDDHPLVVTGLQKVIEACPHIETSGTYPDGKSLLDGLRSQQPDVLLLDMQLPDTTGRELAAEIRRSWPDIRIIVLTSLEATDNIEEMIQAGCTGYLLKSTTDPDRLIHAVERAYRNEVFLDESLQQQMLSNMLRKKVQQENIGAMLTRREKQILQLIADEYTNQEIAEKLYISIRTSEFHRVSLLQKFGVKNTAGLVKKAMELKLIR